MSKVAIFVSEITALRLFKKASDQKMSVENLLDKLSLNSSEIGKSENHSDVGSSDFCGKKEAKAGGIGSAKLSPWVNIAVERAKELEAGTEFSFGSLMRNEWEQMPSGSKSALGKVFRGRLESGLIAKKLDEDWIEIGLAPMAKYRRL